MVDDRTVSRELQELIVSRIRQGQETMADAIKTWTRAAQSMKAQIPSLPGQEIFTSRLPSPEAFISRLPRPEAFISRLPRPEDFTSRLPRPEDFTSRLPRPETMVSGAYDIAVQLIAAQRRLGEQVTQAATPLIRQGAARFGPGSAPAASTSLTRWRSENEVSATILMSGCSWCRSLVASTPSSMGMDMTPPLPRAPLLARPGPAAASAPCLADDASRLPRGSPRLAWSLP